MKLSNPPLKEAILDFKISTPVYFDDQKLSELKEAVRDHYPNMEMGEFKPDEKGNEDAKPATFSMKEKRENAVWFWDKDRLELLQFRNNGFAVNRLPPYLGLNDMLEKFKKFWKVYQHILPSNTIERIAMRYMNSFELSATKLSLVNQLFFSPINPMGKKNKTNYYFIGHGYKENKTGLQAEVSQSVLLWHEEKTAQIMLDINTYIEGKWKVNDETIWENILLLRNYKNKIFSSYLKKPLIDSFK